MMWKHSSCAGGTQLQQVIAAVRRRWERVGHRAGTAGLETAWTSEFLRRMVHGIGQSGLYRVVLVSEMQKVFHSCGSRRSMASSHAAQARKSMLAVTASQPTNKPTTLKHLPPPLPSHPPDKLLASFKLT
jgi:hypothetical protein